MEQPPNDSSAVVDVPGLSHILTPGSSLHPTFILIMDCVFACLLLLLSLLAGFTRSIHFVALALVSLGLWASVKWFVNELRQAPPQKNEDFRDTKKED